MRATDPFFVRGGNVACLLIHGFSANPADLRPLADALAAHGYTVHAPLLPGHGPTLDGNTYAAAREWTGAVAQAHDSLLETCRSVFVIGHSMGGSLAILDAIRRPPSGLVLIAVATVVGGWRSPVLRVAKYAVRWYYPLRKADFADPMLRERVLQRFPGIAADDPQVQARLRKDVRVPLVALDASFGLMRRARRSLGRVTAPTLIVNGRLDRTAPPACAEEIYQKLGSPDKELAWFESSGHQPVLGQEGGAVVERIAGWIGKRAGRPQA